MKIFLFGFIVIFFFPFIFFSFHFLFSRNSIKSKAGYTAIPVADGWAGAEICVFTLVHTNGTTDG